MAKGNIRKFRNHESGCEHQKLYSKKQDILQRNNIV